MLLCSLPLFSKGIKITHGPYICDMDSTAVTIMWKTNRPGMSWVELAPEDGKHFYGESRPKYYATTYGRRTTRDSVHQVRIEGLTPNTRYRYRIFTQELTGWRWSDYAEFGEVAASSVYKVDPYSFKTYPTGKRDVAFLVVNDIHERAAYLKDLCKNIDFKKLDFVMLNGDMSQMVESEDNIYKAYVDTCVSMFATSVPMILNRGNHETRGKFADYLFRYFPTPTGRFYQLKTICGIDFLLLDNGEDKPDDDIEYGGIADYDNYRKEQVGWLRGLRETGQIGKRPLIVFSHIPHTTGNWHGVYSLQETIVPELNKLNVSVVLSGHTHQHGFAKPDSIIHYPNLINSNMAYLLCQTKNGKLEVECAEVNGANKKHFTFELK